MKIIHLCLGNYYADRYTYQENLLPKYHKELGYCVEIVASPQSFDDHGKICYLQTKEDYFNEYNIRVTRLPYKNSYRIWRKLRRYKGTEETLEKKRPDILFIHGCQFLDIDKVILYIKKNPQTIVYVDNHADFKNSATNWISRNILHRVIWKKCAQMILPYTKKFYGVLPGRVDFLMNVYGIPKDKCELLVIGGDDVLIENARKTGARNRIRKQYGISEQEFLIVSGGKINQYRPEVLNLMQALVSINRPNVKLLFFGRIIDELKSTFDELCCRDCIINVGWVNAEATYEYIAASDLVVFPGLHSVLWEQAVSQGIPCVFRNIEGFSHVDVGGNAKFLEDVTTDGIRKTLIEILDNPEEYNKMKHVAEEKGLKTFSYREIARRSIQ